MGGGATEAPQFMQKLPSTSFPQLLQIISFHSSFILLVWLHPYYYILSNDKQQDKKTFCNTIEIRCDKEVFATFFNASAPLQTRKNHANSSIQFLIKSTLHSISKNAKAAKKRRTDKMSAVGTTRAAALPARGLTNGPRRSFRPYSRSCMLIRSISLFRLSFSRQAK